MRMVATFMITYKFVTYKIVT